MKHLRIPLAFAAALALSGCGLTSLFMPPTTAGTAAPVTPLGNTVVDEQVIKLAFQTLDTAAISAKALVATHVITAGSPKALAIADGLDTTRKWLNFADKARRAGNATSANAAYAEATQAMSDLTDALK